MPSLSSHFLPYNFSATKDIIQRKVCNNYKYQHGWIGHSMCMSVLLVCVIKILNKREREITSLSLVISILELGQAKAILIALFSEIKKFRMALSSCCKNERSQVDKNT